MTQFEKTPLDNTLDCRISHPGWIKHNFLITFQSYAFAFKRPNLAGSTAIATYLNDCLDNGVFNKDDDESKLFEVIGNIYQNPELINS